MGYAPKKSLSPARKPPSLIPAGKKEVECRGCGASGQIEKCEYCGRIF